MSDTTQQPKKPPKRWQDLKRRHWTDQQVQQLERQAELELAQEREGR